MHLLCVDHRMTVHRYVLRKTDKCGRVTQHCTLHSNTVCVWDYRCITKGAGPLLIPTLSSVNLVNFPLSHTFWSVLFLKGATLSSSAMTVLAEIVIFINSFGNGCGVCLISGIKGIFFIHLDRRWQKEPVMKRGCFSKKNTTNNTAADMTYRC